MANHADAQSLIADVMAVYSARHQRCHEAIIYFLTASSKDPNVSRWMPHGWRLRMCEFLYTSRDDDVWDINGVAGGANGRTGNGGKRRAKRTRR